jgi:hypothetical protein
MRAILLFLFFFVSVSANDNVLFKKMVLGKSIRNIEASLFEKGNEEVSSQLESLLVRANQIHNNPQDYEGIAEALKGIENVLEIASKEKRQSITFNLTIFDSFVLTKAFVETSDARFVFELLGSGRESFVTDFLALADSIPVSITVTHVDVDTFVKNLFGLLENQTKTNPPQYVSHGTDHSVRVMNWAKNLLQIEELSNGISTYNLPENRVKFALSTLGLIHDIGYSDLDKHSISKWLHSIASGKMTEQLLNMGKAKSVLCADNTKFCEDFVDAIRYHNFDETFCIWTTNSRFTSSCTFNTTGNSDDPTSSATPLLPAGQSFTRNYVRGSTGTTPLHFVVRVADNLDAIRTRLTPVQDDEKMMKYFFRLYVDFDLRKQYGLDSKSATYKTTLTEAQARAIAYSGLTNITQAQKDVMAKADAQSFLHFYSNWIIKDSYIDSENWLINVTFWEVDPPLDFDSHIGAALFQINRFASSAVSLSTGTGGTNFAETIRVSFNLNSKLNSGGYLPLKSFTQKPFYTATGIKKDGNGVSMKLCSPYCDDLTSSLTQSFEKCLDSTEKIVDCDNSKFSALEPYDSLNYGKQPEISEQSSDDTNEEISGGENSGSSQTNAIIIGVIFGVTILLLSVVIAFLVLRKKT